MGGVGYSGLTCGSEWLEVEVRQSSRDLRRPPAGRDHLCTGLLLRPSVTVAPRWGGRRSSASFFIRRSSSNWPISSDTIKARHMSVLIKTTARRCYFSDLKMLLTNNTSITAKRWLKILLDENDSLCTLSRPRWS